MKQYLKNNIKLFIKILLYSLILNISTLNAVFIYNLYNITNLHMIVINVFELLAQICVIRIIFTVEKINKKEVI